MVGVENMSLLFQRTSQRFYYLGQVEAISLLRNVEYFLKCGEKQCRLTFRRIYAIISSKSQPKRRWLHEKYKPANYGNN